MQPSARVILGDISRQLVAARAVLEREIERLERLEFRLAQLLRDPRQSIAVIESGATANRRRAAQAVRGAARVEILGTVSEDHRIAVRIDNSTVGLPPKLAALLEIIAADEGEAPDRFVGWKHRDQVLEALTKRFPTLNQVSPNPKRGHHVLDNLLSRLRQELGAQGLHPLFVQTDRVRRAVRFAVLRREAPPAG